jgi:peptidoglycan hydrolase CwlO-like protein
MAATRRDLGFAAAVILVLVVVACVITGYVTLVIEQQRISACLISTEQLPEATARRCGMDFPGWSAAQAQVDALLQAADQAARQQDADHKEVADLRREVAQLEHQLDQLTE